MTLVFPTPENLDRVAALLRAGGVVALPTETVYGLAANAFDAVAVARIFEIKQRPAFDPLIVHVLDEAMLARVAADVPDRARKLAAQFWPGPLTLVLKKHPSIPGVVTSGLPTVAVRVPAHPVARALLARSGVPLAAPSANRFGRLSPTRAEHVAHQLGDSVDCIIDGGRTDYGIESTILSVEPRLRLLRTGAIPVESLEDVAGPIAIDQSSGGSPVAPGQLAHHYAPRTPLRIVEDAVPEAERAGAAFVGMSQAPPGYARVRFLSPRGDLREAAARLFETLHELDEFDLQRIDVEAVPERGLGIAIMDRLRRAAAR